MVGRKYMTRLRTWWVGCDRCPTRRFHRAVIAQNRLAIERMHSQKIDSKETISIPKETAVAIVEQGFCDQARQILRGEAIPYHKFKYTPVLICPYCDLAGLLMKENDASEVSGSSRNPERKAKE